MDTLYAVDGSCKKFQYFAASCWILPMKSSYQSKITIHAFGTNPILKQTLGSNTDSKCIQPATGTVRKRTEESKTEHSLMKKSPPRVKRMMTMIVDRLRTNEDDDEDDGSEQLTVSFLFIGHLGRL